MSANAMAAIVDVAVLAAACVLAYLKVLPSEAAVAILSAVVAARAAMMRPPGDGGAGGSASPPKGAGVADAGSGAAAILTGVLSLFRPQHA